MTATLHIRPYREADEPAVVALWRDSGLVMPWNDPVKDIARKLHVQRDHFLVGSLDGRVVATVMANYEGHSGLDQLPSRTPDCRSAGGLASA